MKFGSKILGVLLIAAVVVVTPLSASAWAAADDAVALPVGSGDLVAGCHMHGDKILPDASQHHSPHPARAKYQCCLTGHNAAAVQSSYSPRPSAEYAPLDLPIEPGLTASFLSRVEVSTVLFADPPGTTPLRI